MLYHATTLAQKKVDENWRSYCCCISDSLENDIKDKQKIEEAF